MNQKDLTVFIGRFSPFHNGHAAVLDKAMSESKAVLILIGSSHQARTTKNPFTFDERSKIILDYVSSKKTNCKVACLPLPDAPYNNQEWIKNVQTQVNKISSFMVEKPKAVYLTGAKRDSSSWYLNAFGDFFKIDLMSDTESDFSLSATKVRDALFGQWLTKSHEDLINNIPEVTRTFLHNFIKTTEFEQLKKEYDFIQSYKKAWETAPYAPTFVTADACVIQSGHVLVNVRDNFPGVGLWALPGGFVEQNELLIDASVRELIEETRIELSKAQLYGSIKSKEIFDHPDRSLRGRTITTCFLFKLDDSKPLPKVKPQKGEVSKVMWIPIDEALQRTDMWFEDHLAIASWGINKCR